MLLIQSDLLATANAVGSLNQKNRPAAIFQAIRKILLRK
jgi:hypothetical protein